MTKNNSTNRIYIVGHRGMVGSAIARKLLAAGDALTTSSTLHAQQQHAQSIKQVFDVLRELMTARLTQTPDRVCDAIRAN